MHVNYTSVPSDLKKKSVKLKWQKLHKCFPEYLRLAIISMKKNLSALVAIICWILKACELFTVSASSDSHVHGNHLGSLIQLGQSKDAAALKWSQMVLRDAAVCCPQMSSDRPKKISSHQKLCDSRSVFALDLGPRVLGMLGQSSAAESHPSLTLTVQLMLAAFVLNTAYISSTCSLDRKNVLNILYMHFLT